MGERYRPDPEHPNLLICGDCTMLNAHRIANVGGDQDPTVRILDRDVHDRHHVELAAAADPAQGSLL
jgi:hypothetical protein